MLPGRKPIGRPVTVRIPEPQIKKLDELAAVAGKPRAAVLRAMVIELLRD